MFGRCQVGKERRRRVALWGPVGSLVLLGRLVAVKAATLAVFDEPTVRGSDQEDLRGKPSSLSLSLSASPYVHVSLNVSLEVCAARRSMCL